MGVSGPAITSLRHRAIRRQLLTQTGDEGGHGVRGTTAGKEAKLSSKKPNESTKFMDDVSNMRMLFFSVYTVYSMTLGIQNDVR